MRYPGGQARFFLKPEGTLPISRPWCLKVQTQRKKCAGRTPAPPGRTPASGGYGGAAPRSFSVEFVRCWPRRQAGRHARFSSLGRRCAVQGAGRSVSRRAPRSCFGCVAFGFGSGWFRPPAGVFQPPLLADRSIQGQQRGRGRRPGGAQPQPQQVHGATRPCPARVERAGRGSRARSAPPARRPLQRKACAPGARRPAGMRAGSRGRGTREFGQQQRGYVVANLILITAITRLIINY